MLSLDVTIDLILVELTANNVSTGLQLKTSRRSLINIIRAISNVEKKYQN